MSGPGTSRVVLRRKESMESLDQMVKKAMEQKISLSPEVQALMGINVLLNATMDLIGDLINEISPMKYNDEPPEDL